MKCYRIRNLLITLLILISIHCAFIPASGEGSQDENNLIWNGGFELLEDENLPDGWYTDAWYNQIGYTEYHILQDEDPERGQIFEICNAAPNDARIAQVVDVDPDTVYCLSGYIRASGIEGGRGANLSIEGIYAFSEDFTDTDNEWRYVEYYGETGPDQTWVTVYARVGGYGDLASGSACFDDIRLTAVDAVPDDVIAARWYSIEDARWDDSDDETAPVSRNIRPFLLFCALLWCALLISAVMLYTSRPRTAVHPAGQGRHPYAWALGLIFLVSLAFRMFISSSVEGYLVDVNCFLSWGNTMKTWGPVQFYQQSGFCDYPPLYTYVLGLNSWTASVTGASPVWTQVIFRLIPNLCDLLLCLGLFVYAQRRHPEHSGFYTVLFGLMAFNPLLILNSSAWGQMDSVLCLMLVMVALCAIENKWAAALPIYALSVLVKPQALMLGFLGVAAVIITWIRRNEARKSILTGILLSVATLIAGILPFGIRQPFGWLYNQYRSTLASYPFATLNTANIYYLFGGNWTPLENTAHVAVPIIFACASLAYAVLWTWKYREVRFRLIETVIAGCLAIGFIVCAACGASWTYTGTGAMAFAFLITISLAVRKSDIRFLPYLGALLFILLYVFGIKMHERYLLPAIFLLACAYAVQRDRRILWVLALFTVTVFVNEGIILDNSIRLGSESGHLLSDTTALADVLSVLNILGSVYAVLLGYRLLQGSDEAWAVSDPPVAPEAQPGHARTPLDYHPDRKLHWNRKDTAILLVVTVLYSLVSLLTLGSTKAPQTCWSSSGYDEEIVFDLGQSYDDIRVLYFGQVSMFNFSLAQSEDGISWSEETAAEMAEGQCWKWKYAVRPFEREDGTLEFHNYESYVVHFSGRYIRLRAEQVGLRLNEVIFRGPDGNAIPATIHSHTGGLPDSVLYSDPSALIDEPDTLEAIPVLLGDGSDITREAQPSWWNSTYFDEIYHARTGYEFTQGTTPYETTHPPLGKVFISWCITLFGMTPFGWRFAGALAGILMLPGIYLLTKQLTKKTLPAAVACILMSLDCMHLTQTQIATIDSYPVLFIIFAYFFMLRYMQTDIAVDSLRRAVIPLAFSGLFMGLAIASKWIGIYAGAGLAVLYVWHGIRHIRLRYEADRILNSPGLSEDQTAALLPYSSPHNRIVKRLILISLWCVLFFIVVPAAIYLLSYVPYMAYNTRIHSIGDYLSAVWQSQLGMLRYHSQPGLGMDHYYYSPWYEWPIIWKPMYYAMEEYVPSASPVHFSIFSFGNPVIWWGGLFTLLVCFLRWLSGHRYISANGPCDSSTPVSRWHFMLTEYDIRYGFLFIGLLAQYLPWVLVPRGTYIYHYFASVPFLLVSASLCLFCVPDRMKTLRRWIAILFCILAAASFILFFPYASGLCVPREWLDIGGKILTVSYPGM